MNATDAVLVARGLCRDVRGPGGRQTLLQDVHIDVRRGESVAIMGRSGSGKTTLLSILGLLSRASQGSLEIDGVEAFALGDRASASMRNEKIGFVFQSYSLIRHLSVAQNVELPLSYGKHMTSRERSRRVAAALEAVEMEGRNKSRPRNLSGGEQQRVAIARALVRSPAILLADEPTGALDVRTADVVLTTLLRATAERGATLVAVTHDPEVASRFDRIVQLDAGRVVA